MYTIHNGAALPERDSLVTVTAPAMERINVDPGCVRELTTLSAHVRADAKIDRVVTCHLRKDLKGVRTRILSCRRNGETITPKNVAKILGVVIDSELRYKTTR
jgi:hypothetical protein